MIQAIAVEHRRRYGYRCITAELRRRGMLVNHKRVVRMMREDNLLAVQPRTFVVTTDSAYEFEVFLNLAGHIQDAAESQMVQGAASCHGQRPVRLRSQGCRDRRSIRRHHRQAFQTTQGRALEPTAAPLCVLYRSFMVNLDHLDPF